MNAIRQWFTGLADRERLFVLAGVCAAALVLLLSLLLPLNRAASAAQQRVADKRRDLVWLQAVAPQVASAAEASPAPGESNESLVVLADRVAQATGIARSLTGSQPSGNGGLRVRLEKAPFDALATWLGQLSQQYGVGVETASVDALPVPGLVNATIVLRPR
jgi:general secretion pathway protein M